VKKQILIKSYQFHCVAAIAGLALLFCARVSAADVGYVQIKSDPGLQVLLDGKFQGVTKEDVGGMILNDVAVGTHSLKVLKANFNPQEKNIQLTKDQIYVWEIKSLTPGTQISEEGNSDASDLSRQVGNLVIQSVPVEATVEIPKLQAEPFTKSKETWKADAIPAGEYKITVKALGKSASCKCRIESGKTVKLLANILEGKVRNLSDEEESESKKSAEKQKQEADALNGMIDEANALLRKHPGNEKTGVGFSVGTLYKVGMASGGLKERMVEDLDIGADSIRTMVSQDGSSWYKLVSGYTTMDPLVGGFTTKEDAEAMKSVLIRIQVFRKLRSP
jgi:hypothetical protein